MSFQKNIQEICIEKNAFIRKYRLAACDITSNCNLRCKFCFNDFGNKNINMTKDILTNALKVLPYVEDTDFVNGTGFYFSCLWEPTIHPEFIDMLEMLPKEGKEKIFFTSNFAKKMDRQFFERLSKCNLHHINISIETLNQDRYKAITGGGEVLFENFFANLSELSDCFSQNADAPKVRFITMALQANYDEIIDIIKMCHEKYNAYMSEIRTPFWGGYLLKFQDELLSQESIVKLQNQLNELTYTITHTLKFQDVADLDKEAQVGSAGGHSTIRYADMAEDYYDLRIDSEGGLHWNGDQARVTYMPSNEYSQIFEQRLLELTAKEVAKNKLALTDAEMTSLSAAKRKGKNSHINLDTVRCATDYMEITGWAGCSDVDGSTTIPVLVIGDKNKLHQINAYVGKRLRREDVASAFGEAYAESGFRFLINSEDFIDNKVGRIFYYDVEKECFVFECRDYIVYDSDKLMLRRRYAF